LQIEGSIISIFLARHTDIDLLIPTKTHEVVVFLAVSYSETCVCPTAFFFEHQNRLKNVHFQSVAT